MGKKIFYNFTLKKFVYLNLCILNCSSVVKLLIYDNSFSAHMILTLQRSLLIGGTHQWKDTICHGLFSSSLPDLLFGMEHE